MYLIRLVLLLALSLNAYALVSHTPEYEKIELAGYGELISSSVYENGDVGIQVCQVKLSDVVIRDQVPVEHTDIITVIYNFDVKNTANTRGIDQGHKVMLWNHRKRLELEKNYFFPLKWSPDLAAFVCFDKWDGIWDGGIDATKTEAKIDIVRALPKAVP
jgi:hypothetical protein